MNDKLIKDIQDQTGYSKEKIIPVLEYLIQKELDSLSRKAGYPNFLNYINSK